MREGQVLKKGAHGRCAPCSNPDALFYSNPLGETRQIPGVSYENTRANQRRHPIRIENIGRRRGSLVPILI